MKTPDRRDSFPVLPGIGSSLLPLFIGLALFLVDARGSRAAGTAKEAAPGAFSGRMQVATNQPSSAQVPGSVNEVLKMADAGVSSDVIKAYVECTDFVKQLTAAEVIALKQRKVSDEIVTLMLKRGAETRAASIRVEKDNLTTRLDLRRRAAGGFDPEGYEYFQHYYLQPRALASAYQRLSPYYYRPYTYRYSFRR